MSAIIPGILILLAREEEKSVQNVMIGWPDVRVLNMMVSVARQLEVHKQKMTSKKAHDLGQDPR